MATLHLNQKLLIFGTQTFKHTGRNHDLQLNILIAIILVSLTHNSGQLALDMVWAEILVAALAGSAFYGVIALVEKTLTFWHPSQRG